MKLIEPIVASVNEFCVLRRDLHAHPELQELIPLGATYWVRLAERWLGPGR